MTSVAHRMIEWQWRCQPVAAIDIMKCGQMQKITIQVALLQVFIANAVIADELIVFVDPEKAQHVIERNEMQYEEIRWHSFPGHVRVAKIRIDLLHEPAAEFSITPFDDVTPVLVKSQGIMERKWIGVITRGGIPEDALIAELERQGEGASAVYDELIRMFNTVELQVGTSLRDRNTGEAIAYQGQYELLPAGQEVGPAFSNVPVFSAQHVEELTYVNGTINVIEPLAGTWRSFTIKRLDNDADYVMIYEWDKSRNHHRMEAPHDPEAWALSELGQKYESLRVEKEAYMQRVAERIAKRNQDRGEQD